MTWQQIICQTTLAHQEAISELFENNGAASVTLQDAADQPLLEPLPGETPLWDHIIVTGLFPADDDLSSLLLMLEISREDWAIQSFHLEQLEDRPWVREWMNNFHPMQFGKRLWIYPSWTTPPDDASVKILLDPGLAFGTGNHPTTALCLQWLDGEALEGKTVLDYGCGSGILAIAAAKLGAAEVIATDIDPQALEATNDNSQRNDIIHGQIKTCYPAELPAISYDVVVANILAGPLVKLAADILKQTHSGTRIALSGILAEQQAMVKAAYAPHLNDLIVTQKEDWIRLEGTVK